MNDAATQGKVEQSVQQVGNTSLCLRRFLVTISDFPKFGKSFASKNSISTTTSILDLRAFTISGVGNLKF